MKAMLARGETGDAATRSRCGQERCFGRAAFPRDGTCLDIDQLVSACARLFRRISLFIAQATALYAVEVIVGPVAQRAHRNRQRATELGQSIFDLRRNRCEDSPGHHSIAFERLEGPCQHLLADAVSRSLDFIKSPGVFK